MAIKIKNLNSGRTIIVKNQNDMFKLKNTGKSFDFDAKPDVENQKNQFDFEKIGDKDREDYINSFAFDANASDETSKDTPLNPQKDPYYDFGSDGEAAKAPVSDFDINDDSGFDANDDSLGNDQFSMDGSENMDGEEPAADEIPSDHQGQIRSVTGANLVYKRQTQDGTYDELWIYTIGKDVKAEFAIRKAILSGTDIDPNTLQSDDGTQRSQTTTVGNVQFISISGVPQ